MGFVIKGAGGGNEVIVSDDNRLHTKSISTSLQHYISHHKGLAYQVSGSLTVAATDEPILILTNNDPNHTMVVTYIRINTVGVAAASTAAYSTVLLSDGHISGGTALTPTNMKVGSPNAANVISYEHGGSLVTTGGTEIDRNYQANSMEKYDKEGTIIIPKGSSIAVNFKGSTAAGLAYCRISFFFDHL